LKKELFRQRFFQKSWFSFWGEALEPFLGKKSLGKRNSKFSLGMKPLSFLKRKGFYAIHIYKK